MGKLIDVKVPDIGDYKDVPVIELLVKDGDAVTQEQPLLVLESDKATMEVPAPEAGTVRGIAVKVGDRVGEGTLICQLETAGAAAEPPPPEQDGKPAAPPPSKPEAPPPSKPAAVETAAAPAPASSGRMEVTIPDIGDYKDVPVIEVLVKDGDAVDKEQALLVLESDKATMEVPSPAPGVIRSFRLKVGDRVSRGDAVCTLETAGEASAPAPDRTPPAAEAQRAGAPAPEPAPAPAPPAAETPQAASGAPGRLPYAGPATRKFARELGADLGRIRGSGKRGRITIEDVQAYVKQALKAAPAAAESPATGIPPMPVVDFSLFGEIETQPLPRIRKLSATHLHRCWLNIPHVTQTDEADITELEAFRKAQSEEVSASGGVKLTLLPFVMKACEKALTAFPDFASSLSPDGASLIRKKYRHIGFAADTPNGLVVPVVRDVDRKGIVELARESAELAKKARDGKLQPDEMRGGVFSISSLGGIGGSHFTPIVNGPEVGILGVSRATIKPVWDGQAFQPRLMLPLSLSYDHRVIDGAYGARFMVYLVKLLSDLRRLLL